MCVCVSVETLCNGLLTEHAPRIALACVCVCVCLCVYVRVYVYTYV